MSIQWKTSHVSMTELGVYLDWQRNPNGTAYNCPVIIPLPKGADEDRLRSALKQAILAHPGILSRFRLEADGSVSRLTPIGSPEEISIVIRESSGEPDLKELIQPFTDPEGDLYRLQLIHGKEQAYLFADMHHLVYDASSAMVLINETDRIYRGEAPEGEPLSAADIAEKEWHDRDTEAFAGAKGWYDQIFLDAELSSKPIHDREDGEERNTFLVRQLDLDTEKIKEFNKKLGIRTSTFFLGVYGYLLSRFSGEEEALYATVHNGRTRENAKTVGMLVKTLPVLQRFDAKESIRDHLVRLDGQIRGSRENDLFSFADAVSRYSLDIPTLFAYQGDLEITMDFLGGRFVLHCIQSDDPKEEIVAEVFRFEGAYSLRVSWRADLFERESMEHFAASYEQIAREFLEAETFGQVNITSKEQLAALDSFLPLPSKVDAQEGILPLFCAWARKRPEGTALIIGDRKWTYGEVDALSDRIACALKRKGIGRGQVVSILIHRNEYMMIASLGVLKSGAGYQPLDPSYPSERLVFMVKDAGAALVIADEDLTGLLDGSKTEFLLTGDIPSLPDVPEGEELPVPGMHDLFALLYTSGSTGVPKGVVLEHGNLANFSKWYREELDLREDTVHAAYASYGFDANMMDLYPSLTAGGCVCVIPEEIRLNLPELGRYLEENHVSVIFMTTQVGRQFALSPSRPACVRALLTGGEKLSSMTSPEGVDFYNVYGPTECTILSTWMKVDREYLNIPIGYPVANAALYVVDQNGKRLPPCVPGELWIAGPGVSRCSLNRPDKSAESFTPNPFCCLEGYDRVYHTGDVVRFLPGGALEFIGRRDGQVKVRGFRIELTEVEMVIREFPGITDVTVQAFEDSGTGEKHIAAYIVSSDQVDISALNRFIGERKPPYMIPAFTMQIPAIPLNQNGKVNRKALPEPVLESAKGAAGEEETYTDNRLEAELRKAVEEIIGSGRIPRQVTLEQAGLTSIGVIRLTAFVYNRFGVNIPLKAFDGLSLLGLENEILSAWMDGGKMAEQRKEETAGEDFTPFPLSAAQLGVYMECVKQPETAIYHIPMILEFSRETDPRGIASAVSAVIKAHPSVRIHFEMRDSQVMAVKNVGDPVSVPVLEMSEEERLHFQEGFPAAFHLNEGPLYAFTVIRTDKAVYLYVDFHHLVFDGFSLDLFMRDLGAELSGRGCEKEKAGYAEFVRDQQTLLEGEAAGEYDAYFSGLFEKYEAPSQIAPDLSGSGRAGQTRIVHRDIPQKVVDRALRRTGVSEAAFFLAAVNYVTARLTNSDNVYISTISSGRSDVRFASTYGMFVNTLPLFSELTRGTVDEFITEASKSLAQAIAHENYPFARIAGKWDYSVQLMYAYQRGLVQMPDIPGLTAVNDEKAKHVQFPLFVQIVNSGSDPAIEILYDDSLYSADLSERIVECLRTVVLRFAEKGDVPLRGVSMLSEEEERRLEAFHTEPEIEEVPEDTFHFSGLERSARLYPDRTALIAVDGTFTYREFDTLTDRIANALIKRGAKVGGSALILLPRTSRALFACFGASKAGLGYIPFDPTYPMDRINLVIEDSGARFVITNDELLPRFKGGNAVDIEELLKETDSSKPHVPLTQDHISYMIYTSGSTGRPKGVMLTHRGTSHYVADMPGKEMINLIRSEGSVFCSITTLSFDVSVMEYTVTLSHGLTLCFATEAECNNADLLAERMLETKSDIISGTPSRIYTFLSSARFCEALRQNVKVVICGGEKYPEKLLKALKELVPHTVNLYGPSEITISCNEHDLVNDDIISIGRPTPGVKEYIVDTDGNELPIGTVGELYIGGWGVGRGYNNLPEMTAERFISYKGERVFKSGDYARWLPNGYIEVLGRKDNQIKLRGLRIELGEIETVLSRQPGMKHFAVKIEKINGIEHLCAWFTNEKKVDIRALKEAMGKTLTPYMVPTAYMQMKEMPFTPNGKLDMKNLPVPEVYREEGDSARTKAEKDFCEIFSSLLSVPDVMATESFFNLGGTSLLVTQVVIEAGKRGYNIVFGDVFSHPTPRALASLFEKLKDKEAPDSRADLLMEDYDYEPINELLKKNTLESFLKGEPVSLGNVLLTGATGYLGMHVLHELMESTDSRVYCLVRGGQQDPEMRLKNLLMYYFESPGIMLFGKRIIVLEGDITDREKLMSFTGLPIHTVINCAASVKHFAADSGIEDINFGGTKNVIDFCLSSGAAMIQTSTMSVIEIGYKDGKATVPNEQTLHFGQDLTNKYVRSKFLAERAVLEAVVRKGLRAKIMRYGNLSARFSDGEFQINFESNNAMGSLRAYATLGCAAYDQLNGTMEFSPIDMVAQATVKLAGTPAECTLFHVLSDQYLQMVHVFNEMNAMGHTIRYTERDEYERAFAGAMNDPEAAPHLTSLIAYTMNAGERERQILTMDQKYTLQVLYRLGFVWPINSWDYFRRFMGVLDGLGYFDKSFED